MSFFGPAHVHYSCTGFVIAENRVLTAAHCVGDSMRTDGHLVREVIKADKVNDLAVLDTPTLDLTNSQKPALPLRDQPLERFENVIGLGYAFGFEKPLATFNQVMILAYTPDADEMGPGVWVSGGYHPGMSGGPLVDAAGYVVGVVQRTGDGIGYSVTTLTIRAFLLGTR